MAATPSQRFFDAPAAGAANAPEPTAAAAETFAEDAAPATAVAVDDAALSGMDEAGPDSTTTEPDNGPRTDSELASDTREERPESSSLFSRARSVRISAAD